MIFQLLDCSTAHAHPDDRALLERGTSPALYGSYDYGWIVWVPDAGDMDENIPSWREAGFTDHFIRLMQYAAAKGCARLQLDTDGEEFGDLPTFDDDGKQRCDACGQKGWLHMSDSMGRGPGIERCDDCKRFESDDDAAAEHAKTCNCGLTTVARAKCAACDDAKASGLVSPCEEPK